MTSRQAELLFQFFSPRVNDINNSLSVTQQILLTYIHAAAGQIIYYTYQVVKHYIFGMVLLPVIRTVRADNHSVSQNLHTHTCVYPPEWKQSVLKSYIFWDRKLNIDKDKGFDLSSRTGLVRFYKERREKSLQSMTSWCYCAFLFRLMT